MGNFKGEIVVTDEAVRRWPESVSGGYIRDANVVGQDIDLGWGAWTSIPEKKVLSWEKLREELPDGLPLPTSARAHTKGDSFILTFEGDEESELLKPVQSDGAVHRIGTLMYEGWHPAES